MNQYYSPLKIRNTDALRSDWDMPFTPDEEYIGFFRGGYDSILDPTFLMKLKQLSPLNGILIINRNGSRPETTAHNDIRVAIPNGPTFLTSVGLNIVIDRATKVKSAMQWFSFNSDNPIEIRQTTLVQTGIISYELDQLNLEESHSISDNVTIVRTNKPHMIVLGDGTRTSLSIRFVKQWNTWEQAVNDFQAAFNQ